MCLKSGDALEDRSDIGEGWNWVPAAYGHTIFGEQVLSRFGVFSDGDSEQNRKPSSESVFSDTFIGRNVLYENTL